MVAELVESVPGVPAPRLRAAVAGYTGYRVIGPAGTHRGLPSGSLTCIISVEDPVRVTAFPGGTGVGDYAASVGGLHAAPATIAHDGVQHGLALALTPLGARQLLGMPAAALSAAVVDLGDVLGRAVAHELVERCAATTGWGRRFAVLDEVLGRVLRDVPPVAAEVAHAWRRLAATDGLLAVAALAAEVGWSRRHLGERFRAEIGLTPKVAARVLRFDRARRLLSAPVRPGLAEIAAVAGYADQSHLTREWRDLAGCTPSTWIAEELPPVRDGGALAGAHSHP